jgi:hypothetical protein
MICSDMSCKYCSDTYKCKYPKKDLKMSFHSVMTLYQGRQEFLKCNSYEKSEEYIRIEKALSNIDFKKDYEEWKKKQDV